jgi:hypothetical protein
LEGKGVDGLTLDALAARVSQGQFREVILGTTPNVEGDATALVWSDGPVLHVACFETADEAQRVREAIAAP